MKEFEEMCRKIMRESDVRDQQLALQFKMTMVVVIVSLIGILCLIFN